MRDYSMLWEKTRSAGVAIASVLAAVAGMSTAEAQDRLTIANYGGTAGKASSDAIWQPIAKTLGITIKEDTLTGVADVRTQVNAKAVQWDVVEFTTDECAVGDKEGLFETLDQSQFKGWGYDNNSLKQGYVLNNLASYVIGWNKKKLGTKELKSWADFWDVKQFPGVRAMRGTPVHNIEAALFADGVPADKIYPIDLKRGFAKLKEIKPNIRVWWASGGQSAQLARDGEVDMLGIWNTRLQPLIDDGAPYAHTWNGGIMIADCYAVPKGTRNPQLALKSLYMAADPAKQAAMANLKPIAPVTPTAYTLNIIKAEMLPMLPSSPKNLPGQVLMDGVWWMENGKEVQAQWLSFLQN